MTGHRCGLQPAALHRQERLGRADAITAAGVAFYALIAADRHGRNAGELEAIVRRGLTLLEAIRAATIIPFRASGYVALCEVASPATVVVLAVRHQREEDYH